MSFPVSVVSNDYVRGRSQPHPKASTLQLPTLCISFSISVEADAFWFFDGDPRTEARQPRGFQNRSTRVGRVYDLCLLRGHETIMQ